MPIPLIVWGAVAAGSAYLAWKNKDKIGEVLGEMSSQIEEKTERDISELDNKSLSDGIKILELTVPRKDIFEWNSFKRKLKEKAKTSSSFEALYAKAIDIRKFHHPDESEN